jgi:ferric-dicitrate binding protein FerR (iron transport regulator)
MKSPAITEALLNKYFGGKSTENECSAISEWLSQNEHNRQLFAVLKKIQIEQEQNKSKYSGFADKAYARFSGRINKSDQQLKLQGQVKNREYRKQVLRYAAAVLIILVSAGGAFFMGYSMHHDKDHSEYIIEVPYGGRSNITLPDGSHVWLNAGSKLIYSRQFSAVRREVKLEGEAFFDVEKSDQPFIVQTSHLSIHVLGTSFNVKSYPDDENIETTLVEGKIRIEREALANPLFLKPREKMTFHKRMEASEIVRVIEPDRSEEKTSPATSPKAVTRTSGIEILEGVNTEEYTSWKEGDLIFNKEPLLNLARMLERKYDIKFVFQSEDLKNYSYSGTLRDFPLEQVLKALELTSPVKYKIEGKIVTLSMTKTPKQHKK